ncbi:MULTISPECIES: hypothetical protein [unclassified Haladaptatus]|uniref:hypothetical protein n=1 Tax=unclassified Haladaptatus TaxID=2622732 RepID=UPI0023E8BD59|nr:MULTISPECIES: hypothetical protein [unclassified Haladaptatus]
MRVRDWQDILADVVESGADAGDWRAVAGNRSRGLGEDLYIGHPKAGVFQLKTYAKNPFEVKGVGTRVARRIDDDIEPFFPNEKVGGRFGIQSPIDESKAERAGKKLTEILNAHAAAPTTPNDFFEDVMGALESPAFGPLEFDRTERSAKLGDLASTFEEAEKLLSAELDDLIEEDEVGRGFM